jgi:cytochrome c-type biogenesis protein CcmH/NrfF
MQRRQILSLGFASLLAIPVIGQVRSTDPIDAEAYAIGQRLMCQCGCGSTIADCNMLYCHFGEPIREEIREGVVAGLVPEVIIDGLVAKYGEIILAEPSTDGFGAFGWTMPFVAILAGLAAVPIVIRRWRLNQLAVEAAAPAPLAVDEEVLNRFKAEIDRDLAAEE